MTLPTGLLAGPDGWCLAPEGAAVRLSERLAVVSDIHLGYEWARARGGDVVPAHSLSETIQKLDRLLDRVRIDRLISAGDHVESRKRCSRTAGDVSALAQWLSDRGVTLIRLEGNHDPPQRPPLPPHWTVGGWSIAHGHRELEAEHIVIGHHHPVLRADGLVAPCFLVSDRLILLPAFSPNAAGVDCTKLALPPSMTTPSPHCFAGLGDSLLDFGRLDALASRLR